MAPVDVYLCSLFCKESTLAPQIDILLPKLV